MSVERFIGQNYFVVLGFDGLFHIDRGDIAVTLCQIDLSEPPMDAVAYAGETADWPALIDRCWFCNGVWSVRN
jgi:hypothetical protein